MYELFSGGRLQTYNHELCIVFSILAEESQPAMAAVVEDSWELQVLQIQALQDAPGIVEEAQTYQRDVSQLLELVFDARRCYIVFFILIRVVSCPCLLLTTCLFSFSLFCCSRLKIQMSTSRREPSTAPSWSWIGPAVWHLLETLPSTLFQRKNLIDGLIYLLVYYFTLHLTNRKCA